jgi:CBS domain containing-hemolysin-like protein
MDRMTSHRPRTPLRARLALLLAGLAASAPSRASFLSGEALDTAANVVAWIVLLVVPIIVIVIFWLVHVLPEKIAHKNHHPQFKAIKTLCLLSLAFGGLLWPLAWLWAYTKPVAYKVAYGTDKAEDYFLEHEQKLHADELTQDDLVRLKHELDTMHASGKLPAHLQRLHGLVTVKAAERADAQPVSRSA